jgi:hypothetical protein
MLDPLLEWLGRMWRALVAAAIAPFKALYGARWTVRVIAVVIGLPVVLFYLWFIWHALWIRGYDTDYPKRFKLGANMVPAGEQVAVEGGDKTTKTCGRSNVVAVVSYLLDLNVNKNLWMSSNPIYKSGFFWLVSWDRTWFFDNKANFQRGVHQAASRTAIELADALGRARGTSKVDVDLRVAKGNVQFDQFTWYFNPFDRQPFGPTTPSPTFYRNAIKSLDSYNKRLKACNATFDARADNLMQFLDRVAKDIGSASAVIKERSENYNAGWFDTRADDMFMYTKGQLYAYHGILKALRVDFAETVKTRQLEDIWDLMESHIKRAIELSPFIISNGSEDGWLMPTHLTTLGFYILRARSNLVEIRSVLDR